MEDCIFCKIVKGDIPAAKVYENKDTVAFLDIAPANKGHCLIVTRDHFETLLDIPDEKLGLLMEAAKKVTRALSLSVGNGAYNILMNNGEVAGQVVKHAHLHVIPRFKKDLLRLKWINRKYETGEIHEFAAKIKKFL
ncbi:HIT family protein [Candidatus Woesearchaeota archaeon]|nr:HIT family protein [Candidatus Woesearchaeota archaeon]